MGKTGGVVVGAASVGVLGALTVERDGVVQDLGGRKQRAVLGLLLAARTQVVPVDRVIEELWRGEPPPTAMATLQSYVSRLRRVLEPEHRSRAAQVLMSAAPGYALRLPVERVDAWRFEQLVRAGDGGEAASVRMEELDAALRMWHGPAFAEFEDEGWAVPEVVRLEELRWHARVLLIDAALRVKAYRRALIEGEALVHDAPLREEGWRLLALAQYALARQADALATLRRARQTLAQELGIDPGPALRQLEADVLNQSVVLPADTPVVSIATGQPPRQATQEVPRAEASAVVRESGPGELPVLFGRESETSRLLGAAERTPEGGVGMGVVSGEPGVGKTQLLRHVIGELRQRGWLVAFGRCPEVDGAPPAWAWAEALRSLAEQVPVGEFAAALAPLLRDDAPPPSGDATQARFQMHRAAAGWLSSQRQRPIVIVLDDVHRADAGTRAMLASLVQTATRARLFIIISHRVEPQEELTDLLASVASFDSERVRLTGLDELAAAELIASVAGSPPTSVVLRTLLERTEGNPFYLTEFARLLASVGARNLQTVPAGVADVVRRRLARLPDSAQPVLRVAAVIGRTVDLEVLTRATSAAEDTVYDALEAAEMAGLLVEAGPNTVRFAHVLVRDTLYHQIPGVRLRSVHAAVAAAIEAVTPTDVAALAITGPGPRTEPPPTRPCSTASPPRRRPSRATPTTAPSSFISTPCNA
ncbi:MAG: AAA family ATPase [Actinomycetota bacterium]|nr:AAA family ATPase [Actinomycetota bacterium]